MSETRSRSRQKLAFDSFGHSVVTVRDSNRTLPQLSFEKAGVHFMPENGGGVGVRTQS
jgi:hypothetical protein